MPHAVMYNLSRNPARLPNDVVQFHHVDDEGKLWFSLHPPKQCLETIEYSFPAHFCFYQKGLDYYAEAEGNACIEKNGDGAGEVYIKMTPYLLQFNESQPAKSTSLSIKKWYNSFLEKYGLYHFKKSKQYGY
jgi:hypothetical protein